MGEDEECPVCGEVVDDFILAGGVESPDEALGDESDEETFDDEDIDSDLEDNSLYDLNKNYLDKIGEDESLISSGFKSIGDNIKLYMVELYQKYRNIGSVDQIRAIQNDVDEIKTDMKKNMNNMRGNCLGKNK